MGDKFIFKEFLTLDLLLCVFFGLIKCNRFNLAYFGPVVADRILPYYLYHKNQYFADQKMAVMIVWDLRKGSGKYVIHRFVFIF